MTREPNSLQPVQPAVGLLAQKRPHWDAMMGMASDLSFMAMLEAALADTSLGPVNADTEIQAHVEKTPDEAIPEKLSTSKMRDKTRMISASLETAPIAPVSMQTDIKEVREAMWLMDGRDLSLADLTFLQALPNAGLMPWQNINNTSASLLEHLSQGHYKSLRVSAGLQSLLEKAYKTQRPLRIDLADNAAIILRMGRDGRVSAEFLPNDQAADLFFRQNLQELKSRLESKQLSYGELAVRPWKDPQHRGRQRQSADEG